MQLIPIENIFSNRDSIRVRPKKLFFYFQKAEHLYLMASTFAKKHTNYLVSYFWFPCIVFFLFYVIIVIFLSLLSFWVEPYVFPLLRVNILLIKHTNVNSTSLYLKKAGLASRNIVHLLKFHLRCIELCFYIFIFIC